MTLVVVVVVVPVPVPVVVVVISPVGPAAWWLSGFKSVIFMGPR